MATAIDDETPRGVQRLQFDPDMYPHCALKAFNEFVEQYSFRYNAQYTYPPKQTIDNEIIIWKSEHENAEPDVNQLKSIRNDWISKDKVRKLLGFFASIRLQQDWNAAKENTNDGNNVKWDTFLTQMQAYYKPTENHIIRNYEFRQLSQKPGETFSAFCNRVEAAGKNCHFCDCTGTTT